jgi:hypothetical protein
MSQFERCWMDTDNEFQTSLAKPGLHWVRVWLEAKSNEVGCDERSAIPFAGILEMRAN